MNEAQPGLSAHPQQWPKALFSVALLFSIFQIVTAAYHPVSTQVLRAGHVGFLLMLIFLSVPGRGHGQPWPPLAWLLALAGIGTALYQWLFVADLIQRFG